MPDPYKIITTKIDRDLNMIWQTSEGSSVGTQASRNNRACKTFEQDTNTYSIASLYDYPNTQNLMTINCYRYNSNGNQVKHFKFNRKSSTADYVYDALLRNEIIYMAGVSYDSATSIGLLIALNLNLDTLWIKQFGTRITGRIFLELTFCKKFLYLSYSENTATGKELHLVHFTESGNVVSDTIVFSMSEPQLTGFTSSKAGLSLLYNQNNRNINYSLWYDQNQIKEPVSFTSSIITAKSIHLNWVLGAGNADSIFLFRKTQGQTDYVFLKSISALASSFIDTFLNPDQGYAYIIRTKYGQDYSCDSMFTEGHTLLNTSTQASVKRDVFTLYPNPTSDRLFINKPENIIIEKVEVWNTSGQKVASFDSENIHLSYLPKGVYIIRINNTHYHKIIKL